MRRFIALLPLTSLAACGGGGGNGNLQTLSSTAIVSPVANSSTTTTTHSFIAPTETKTYAGVGGVHSYDFTTRTDKGTYIIEGTTNQADAERVISSPTGDNSQSNRFYRGNADTVRSPTVNVTYDPRSAIFTVAVADSAAGASLNTQFQDPAHRVDFAGFSKPQYGVPDLGSTVRYLEAGSTTGKPNEIGSSSDNTTFFYQTPGSSTRYVTFAGYLRKQTSISGETAKGYALKPNGDLQLDSSGNPIIVDATFAIDTNHFERGAFTYGELTPVSGVPKTGSATFSGSMLATMINNPTLDATSGRLPSFFQWISGTSKINVDFATNAVGVALNGTVSAPMYDRFSTPPAAVVNTGASFAAAGAATIDLVGKGGFTGTITSATINGVNAPNGTVGVTGTTQTLNIAGSSVNGAFYGPAAEEVGGGFRIVGGTPDQRIDVLGAFTAAKPQQ